MARDGSGRRQTGWLLLAIIGVGVALRLFGLDSEPLWQDEAFSWRWAHLPLSRIWGDAAPHEYSPPLFFSLQRLWQELGDEEYILRLLPALFGILNIPIAFAIGRATAGNTVGLVAAALVATSAPLIAYSQEYRTYTFMGCAGSVSALGLIVFLRTWTAPEHWPGIRPAGPSTARMRLFGLSAYAIGTALALYAHNTAVILPLIANLMALGWWFTHAQRSRSFATWWILANSAPFLLWLWWVPVMLAQAVDPEARFNYRRPSPSFALFRTIALYSQQYLPLAKPLQLAVPLPALAGFGLWAWRRQLAPMLVPLAFAVGTPLAAFALSWLIRPIWDQRIIVWSLPLGMVLVAAGICAIRLSWVRMLVGGIVVAAQAANLIAYHAIPQKDAWDRLVESIAAAYRPGDAFVLYPFTIHDSFAYYARRAELPANDFILLRSSPPDGYPRVDVQRNVQPLIGVDGLRTLAADAPRTWIVMRDPARHDRKGELAAVVSSLGTVVERREFRESLRLYLIVPHTGQH